MDERRIHATSMRAASSAGCIAERAPYPMLLTSIRVVGLALAFWLGGEVLILSAVATRKGSAYAACCDPNPPRPLASRRVDAV